MKHASSTELAIFLAVLVIGLGWVYGPGLSNELVFDDLRFEDTVFAHYGNPAELRLRWLSYGSFVWLHGLLGESWWAQRLVNVLIHAGVMLGLLLLYRNILRATEWSPAMAVRNHHAASMNAALYVAVLWVALNPVAVYAVAYLIQRSILMATFFVVLGLLFFTRALQQRQPVWHVGALACYGLAMLSKEHALAAPVVALALYIYLRRPPGRMLAAVAGACLVLAGVAAAVLLRTYDSIVGTAFDPLSEAFVVQLAAVAPNAADNAYALSVLNQSFLFFKYALLWLFPNVGWMSIDLRPVFPVSLTAFPHIFGAIGYIVALVGSAAMLLLRPGRSALLGLGVFVPACLFVTEFVTVWIQDPFVLYRSYLWAVGLPALIVLALVRFSPLTIYAIGAVVVLVFGPLAGERVSSLKDAHTVWTDAIAAIDPSLPPNAVGRWRPFMNRGTYYVEHRELEHALADFDQAVAYGEPLGTAQYSRGVVLIQLQRHEEAIEAFARAEHRGFKDVALYFQRAEAAAQLGQAERAIADYGRVIESPPDPRVELLAREKRSQLAMQVGPMEIVLEDLQALVVARPSDERARFNLGMALLGAGRHADAIAQFQNLVMRNSASAPAFYGLALGYFQSGAHGEALAAIARAIAIEPDIALFRNLQADIARGN